MNQFSKNFINFLVVAVVALILGGGAVFVYQKKFQGPGFKTLSSGQASQKALDFINQNLLQGQTTASLVEVTEQNGLYKMKIKVGQREVDSFVTKDGKILFPEPGIDLEQEPQPQTPVQEETSTIGNFKISTDEICKENGKPIFYFFGSQGCPHCQWEHPVVEEVVKGFGDYVSFHNNMDSDADRDVFSKYSTGGIPTLVLGCKYYRVGSGESLGEEQEKKNLTALICKLTENQPTEVCEPVSDLIEQISD